MSPRKSADRPDRHERIDELDMQLCALLHEMRFIADLLDAAPVRLREIDGRGLAVMMNRMATAVDMARKIASDEHDA